MRVRLPSVALCFYNIKFRVHIKIPFLKFRKRGHMIPGAYNALFKPGLKEEWDKVYNENWDDTP